MSDLLHIAAELNFVINRPWFAEKGLPIKHAAEFFQKRNLNKIDIIIIIKGLIKHNLIIITHDYIKAVRQ